MTIPPPPPGGGQSIRSYPTGYATAPLRPPLHSSAPLRRRRDYTPSFHGLRGCATSPVATFLRPSFGGREEAMPTFHTLRGCATSPAIKIPRLVGGCTKTPRQFNENSPARVINSSRPRRGRRLVATGGAPRNPWEGSVQINTDSTSLLMNSFRPRRGRPLVATSEAQLNPWKP